MADDSIKTPADLLRAGATVMRERGLARGVYEDASGRVCYRGAQAVALGGSSFLDLPDGLRMEADIATWRVVGHPPMDWNDNLALDAEDVAAHMEKAAAWWEETH